MQGPRRIAQRLRTIFKIGLIRRAATAQIIDSYQALRVREAIRVPDDIALQGQKFYSQNDEDGVIDAIFAKLGGGASFLEIGVEDGRECNTHLLLLRGWKGSWIEGDPSSIAQIEEALGALEFPGVFAVRHAFVRPDNIAKLYASTCRFLKEDDLDFVSLDIDSNDLFVMEALLHGGARPKVVCVEYNGGLPATLELTTAYAHDANWRRDDYFGASLAAFVTVFASCEYELVTCNLTGANAFFVRSDQAHHFPRRTASAVWRQLRLDLSPLPNGHTPTLRFLRNRLLRASAGLSQTKE